MNAEELAAQQDGESNSNNEQTEAERIVNGQAAESSVPASEDSTEEQIRKGMEKSKFKKLVQKGRNYREDYEFTMFGESTTIQLQPLTDPVYETLMEQVEEDVGEERFRNLVARQMERAKKEDGEIDPEDIDPDEIEAEDIEFGQIGALKMAAKLGIDPESVNMTRQEVMETVDEMVGQKSLDIGAAVLELTADVGKANEFPGSRGRD